MDIEYRFATINDRNTIMFGIIDIMEIEDGTRKFETDEIEKEEWKSIDFGIANNNIYVVENKNTSELIGFIWFTISKKCFFGVDYTPFANNYLWISQVWTKKEYRNNGICSGLYNKLIDHCKSNNIKEIWLDVHNINEKSMKFHKNRGFEPKITLLNLSI